MASSAATAFATQEKQRKRTTYGKRGRSNNTSDLARSFERLGQTTPKESPSRRRFPSTSPSNKAQSEASSAQGSLFDVPSSDDDAPSSHPSPNGDAIPFSIQSSKRLKLSRPTSNVASLRTSARTTPDPFDIPVSDGERAKNRTTEQEKLVGKVVKRTAISRKPKPVYTKTIPTESDANRQVQLQMSRESHESAVPLPAQPNKATHNSEIKDVHMQDTTPGKEVTPKKTNAATSTPTPRPRYGKHTTLMEPVVMIPSPSKDIIGKSQHNNFTNRPKSSSQPPSTPPRNPESSAVPMSAGKIQSTPKQARLWQELLGDETTKYQGPVRQKLVNTLKAPSEHSNMSDDSDEEDETTFTSELMDLDASASSQSIIRTQESTSSSQQPVRHTEHGPKITYAQKRSYLADEGESLDALLQQPIDSPQRPEGTIFDEELSDDEGSKAIRGIHELRAAKNSQRIAFELDDLQIDLADDSTLPRKRNALLELSTKLLDPKFRSEFIQYGHVYQIFKQCRGESDPVVCAATVACVALILSGNVEYHIASQFYEAGMIGLACQTLGLNSSMALIARELRSSMSKFAQTTVKNFSEDMKESSIWTSQRPGVVTPQIISIKSLELLVRRLREGGNGDHLLDDTLLERLLGMLEATPIAPQSDEKSLDQDSPIKLELVLSTLESMTVAPACALSKSLWTEEIMQQLVDTLELAIPWTVEESSTVQALALRLCLNLANNNRRNSDFFARPNFVSKLVTFINSGFKSVEDLVFSEDDTQAFDNLLLGLGTMINLAEWSDAVRQSVLAEDEGSVVQMVKTFLSGREKASEADSIEASRANIPYGYLAILLGDLCQDTDIRAIVREVMPNRRLDPIVDAVEEFITVHKEADRREKGNDHWVAFTNRLQEVANALRDFGQS